MNVKDYMALEYSDLQEGESRSGQLCPSCKGGTTGEHTLSVSRRNSNLLWICHRSSCQLRGGTGSSLRGTSRTSVPETRGVFGRQYVREATALPENISTLLNTRYAITNEHSARHGLGWTEDTEQGQRLVIPVKDYYGEVRGSVLRSFDGTLPKAKSHTEQGAIAWFTNPATTSCIIVEDCLSAIRASDYLTSVALLGTNFNEAMAQEIVDTGLSPVYMALDADAYNKAIKYVIKYRSMMNMRMLRLAKDIKDQTNEELTALFTSIGK